MAVDETPHDEDSAYCWCCPELAYVDPETGASVWVHRYKEDAN